MPERIQLRRTKGWRKPEGAIVVARPTRWGNPIDWRSYRRVWRDDEGEFHRSTDAELRAFAVTDFESAVKYGVGYFTGYPSLDEIRAELTGRDLCCWCPPGQPCHADVLLEIANAPADDTREGTT